MDSAPQKTGDDNRTVRNERPPLHPYTVHFPVAFCATAQALDILYGLTTNPSTSAFVVSIYDARPFLVDIGRMSHALSFLGLLSAIPANVSGGLQFIKLIQQLNVVGKLKAAGSLNQKIDVLKNVHPKLKIAFLHALLGDIVIAGTLWNWYSRKGNVMNAPSGLNVFVSAVTAPILGLGAFLGAKMVFGYGVGRYAGYRSSKE